MATLVSPLPSPLDVVPGEEAVCEVRVRNTSQLVDRYTFEVLGAAGMWTQVTPSELRLLPATEGRIELHLNPPRQPTPPAGPAPFGLRVSSAEQPGEAVVQEGSLEIAPFADTKAHVRPHTARAWRSAGYRVGVSNEGNVAVEVDAGASDPDELLTFQAPGVGRLEPGGTGEDDLRVRTRKFLLGGRAQPRPFEVLVASRPVTGGAAQPIPAQSVSLDATLLHRPLLSWWLLLVPPALIALAALFEGKPAAVVALIVLGLIVFVARRRSKRSPVSPQP